MRRILRTAFIAVDLLIVVLFLAGFMAYYVKPTFFWWFELIAVFLPYLGLLLGLLTVVLAAMRLWVMVGVHGLLLLLLLVRMNPFDRFGDGPTEAGDALAVLTFNVPRWWGYEMPAKTSEMLELMREADADVIGLQEAPVAYYKEEPRLRAAPYVSVLYDTLNFQTIGPASQGATWTPQPVMSRQRLIRQDEFLLRQSEEDTSYTSVTRTQLRWKETDIAVYNVHLRTFGEKKPWEEERTPFLEPSNLVPYLRQYRDAYRVRAWEVEEILTMIRDEELPIILLGDLNSTPNNWVHGRLSSLLRDAYAEEGRGWGMTYHTRLPVVRIDYVFVSEHWDVLSARVLDAYLSDHLPLLVELRLRAVEG